MHYAAKAVLKLVVIPLLQPAEDWEYRHPALEIGALIEKGQNKHYYEHTHGGPELSLI